MITARRDLGFVAALPLYLMLATAVGFVDHRIRPFPAHAYTEYVHGVVAGSADPPARYRILAPAVYTAWVNLTQLPAEDAWISFRWLCLVAAFLAGHWLYRSWFPVGGAVVGNALVAGMLPLTFTNSWGHPDHFIELVLVALGYACIVRRRPLLLMGVVALATANRETSFLVVLMALLAERPTARHLRWVGAAVGAWVVVYVGLRYWLGYVAYNPLHFRENLALLVWWPVERDVYYRLYSWFFVLLLGAPIVIILRTWTAQPRFTRMATAVVTPVFLVIGLTFSSIIEPRIFSPLLPLLAAGLLFACVPSDRGDDAVTRSQTRA